ncbi:MAG TPA: hypothetical protein VGM90_27900 [Kofleriaceae bacterium]
MSATNDFTMPLDLMESLEEPTLPIILLDGLHGPGGSAQVASGATRQAEADAMAARGRVQHAVVIAANDGAPFIAGGRMIRTSPPGPPPRRMARGTERGVPLVTARLARAR